MDGSRHNGWSDYAVAVCVTALIIAAREFLSGWLGRTAPFLPFIAAVLIAAWRGGLGPGLVATALSAAASDFFFVPPVFSLRIEKLIHGTDLAIFVILGMLISSLCDMRVRLVRQLRDADRRKDEFLATLAHELRNPLAPISNALELLPLVESDRAQMSSLRDVLQRQVSQIVRLIDDLMDVSRITHGKIQLRLERVDVAKVVSAAMDSLDPFIKACGHRVTVVLPNAPLLIEADPARLTQVVGNVLHNAAKYTGRDGTIHVLVEREEQTAVIRVHDNGPGLQPEMLTQIFEMFEQANHTLDRSHGGLGIGLTLAKQLLDLHGGTIEARSEGPGKGSEFIITIPALQPGSDGDAGCKRRTSIANMPAIARHRILVVDDIQESATTLAMILRAIGQDASTANDGATAVEWAQENKPEIVFLDIAMPGMDGYEAARRIRESTFHDVALVALTGYGQDEDRKRAFRAGFTHFLTKPITMDALAEFFAAHSGSNARPPARISDDA